MKKTNRPFLPIFFLLIGGMMVANFLNNPLLVSLITGTLFFIWLRNEYQGKPRAKLIFFSLVLCAGYLLSCFAGNGVIINTPQLDLTGVVLSQRNLSSYQRVVVRSPEINSKLALHIPNHISVRPGVWLEFSGTITEPEQASNPGDFSYKEYLASQGVFGLVIPESIKLLGKASRRLTWIYSAQNYVASNLRKNVQDSALVEALVLGNRMALSEEQQNIWQQLGINHLLAISGMHIGLLAMLITYVVQLFPGPSSLRKLFISLILLIYVLLSGGSPSSWRAWLAVVIGLAGTDYDRLDGLHIWSLVGTILLLLAPNLLWQTSFQLSFVASGSILLWSPIISKLSSLFSEGFFAKLSSHIMLGLAVSLVAQVGLFPFLVYYFQEVALVAPVATLLMVPLVFGLLIGGLIVGLVGSLAWPIGWLVHYLTILINHISIWLAQFSPILKVPRLPFTVILLWYFVFVTTGWVYRHNYLFPRRQSNVRWLIKLLCILALLSLPSLVIRPLEITILDVGQGDAIYIRTPYRQHILIDGGGDSVYWQQRGRNVGLQKVVPYLRYRGVQELDLVILSHPHEDHLYGLLAVLENIPVKQIVDNGQIHTTTSYERYLQLIDELDVPYKQLKAGDSLVLKGNIQLDILHPANPILDADRDHNNNSLVVLLNYQGKKLLFTGDLDQEGQRDLLTRGVDKVDWLKVPHHGSRSALYPDFYHAINPRYATISAGTTSHGHPHPEVIQYLAAAGIEVSRTDLHGAISFFVWNGILGRFSSAR